MEFVFCVLGITSAVVLSRLGNRAVLSLLEPRVRPLDRREHRLDVDDRS